MTTTLKAHPIWHNVTQTVAAIDPAAIAAQHFEACSAQINGYWDDADQFYETIRFHPHPNLELISSSLGVTSNHNGGNPWLNLRYALKIAGVDLPMTSGSPAETLRERSLTIGELILVLNDNLEVIDENWLTDVHSPYVLSTQ